MYNLINDHTIYERNFYPFDDNTIALPNQIRLYIDSYSDEFNHLDTKSKLCNLGFAVTRGLDLYKEIKNDINVHRKKAGHENYEENAKSSLIAYIDYLRETELSLTDILPKDINIDLQKIVNLLVEEILFRYREYQNNQEYIVFFESIPVDYAEICNRLKLNSSDNEHLCFNYLMTSQETISKASISKKHLLHLNRWKELLHKFSGSELYFADNMVYPGDEKYVSAYNEARKNKPNKQLILNVPPKPWTGNILNSKLVLLSLNPGYVEHLNKNLANMFKEKFAEEIMEDKRKVLSMEGNFFDYYEPTRILDDYYWRNNITPLGIAVYGEKYKEKIFNQVSLCQYLAYASAESPVVKNLLPSQLLTKMVLFYLATSVKDVKFIVLRASSQWKTLMGEGLWNYLKDNNKLLISEHYRNQCLSEKNIGIENYKTIVEHLKNS